MVDRILRAGPSADLIRSAPAPRHDERQHAFDLNPPVPPVGASSAEQTIYRLAYENAQLRSQLAQNGETQKPPTYRAYNPVHGWTDKVDDIAVQAAGFAKQLADVTAIRTTGEPDEVDAGAVNEHIAMVAEEADALITALVADAEAKGLEASGA